MTSDLRESIMGHLPDLYIYAGCLPITRSEKEILDYSSADIRAATLADVELIERNMHTSSAVEEMLA
jgi:hypothetical protein